MRCRFLKTVLFAVLGCTLAVAQTTTTVTAVIRDLSQVLVTSGKVTFALAPSRDTTISGYARFVANTVTCTINQAAVSTNQAVRAANSVTISGLTGHTFISGDVVTLSGMTDSSFNGTFTLTGVTATTVTYAQTAANATSGGGVVSALRGGAPNGTTAGACVITQNSALQPTGSYYVVKVWPANVATSTFTIYAIGSSLDLTQVVPTPTTSPAQNFVDVFSNQTIGGTKTWTGTQSFSGAISFSGSLQFLSPFTFSSGLTVGVSGTGCATSLQLQNTDVAPVNPNKYWRINQATGALELMNSACNSLLLSLDNAGNLTTLLALISPTQVVTPQVNAPAASALVLVGSTCTSSTVCTATLKGGTNSIGGGNSNGLDVIVQGGNSGGAGGVPGGAVQLNGGAGSAGAGPGSLTSNTSFTKYNNISTCGIVPTNFGCFDQLANTADITAQTLYAVPAAGAGRYRVSVYIIVTTVAGTSSTMPTTCVTWTDNDNNTAQNLNTTASSTGNVLTTFAQAIAIISAKASTNVQVKTGSQCTGGTTYASTPATTMQYAVHFKLEAL